MQQTCKAVILARRASGDPGQFVDVFTEQNTVEEIYVYGNKSASSAGVSSLQQFSYATLSVRRGRGGRVYLDSIEPIRIFYNLRAPLSRLSLATYFSELVRLCVPTFRVPGESNEAFRLFLNTLHFLEKGIRDEMLLKPLFELRLMTELGHMPNLLVCQKCGEYLPQRMVFSPAQGVYWCRACAPPQKGGILAPAAVLTAMRHIVFSDFSRLFSWKLGKENLILLGQIAEAFVQYHLGLRIPALDYYHAVSNLAPKEGAYESELRDPGIPKNSGDA